MLLRKQRGGYLEWLLGHCEVAAATGARNSFTSSTSNFAVIDFFWYPSAEDRLVAAVSRG